MFRSIAACLSYANVMSTLAVFIVLGGGAYAAATLPKHSVGTKQLRRHAVTQAKLAPESVTTHKIAFDAVGRRRLSPKVRNLLEAPGPAGPTGPTGPAGPGAARISFAAAASSAPAPSTVLDTPGLKIQGACAVSGDTVSLPLTITASEASQAQETITADTGTDPTNPTGSQSANLQFDLPAGAPVSPGGPEASGDQYFRVIATLILIAPSRTLTVNAVVIVDAGEQHCSMSGTAVTAR